MGLDTREHEAEVFRQQQKILGPIETAVCLIPIELINRIEGLELDAGFCVKLAKRQQLVDRLGRLGPASVAVAEERQDRLVLSVKQHIIDAPGVDADRVGRIAGLAAGLQSGANLATEPLEIPDQMAVHGIGQVCKAINLAHLQLPVGVAPGGNMPSGGRADIDSQMNSAQKIAPVV